MVEIEAYESNPDPWGYYNNLDDQKRLDRLKLVLDQLSFERVIDIGCGNGFLTENIKAPEVLGVDVSQAAVGWGELRAAELGLRTHAYCTGDILSQEIQNHGYFDLVVLTGVLYEQYVGGAYNIVRHNIDRILVQGGHLISCHILEWNPIRFAYTAIDQQIYQYGRYTHSIELYRK